MRFWHKTAQAAVKRSTWTGNKSNGAISHNGVLNAAGQGLNTALEDGAVLGWHVQEHGLHPDTLRSFEKERIPRISKIAEQEQVCISNVLVCPDGHFLLPCPGIWKQAALGLVRWPDGWTTLMVIPNLMSMSNPDVLYRPEPLCI